MFSLDASSCSDTGRRQACSIRFETTLRAHCALCPPGAWPQIKIFANVSEIMGMVRGGKVRALALAATKPSPLAPELPLLTKDIPALDISNWFGVVGPIGLPADIKASLAKLFLDAIADPKNAEVLAKQGLEAMGEGPDAFTAHIMKDRERWAKVVRKAM